MHFAIKGFYNGFVLVIIDISIYIGTELSDWDKDQAKRYLDYIDSTFTISIYISPYLSIYLPLSNYLSI